MKKMIPSLCLAVLLASGCTAASTPAKTDSPQQTTAQSQTGTETGTPDKKPDITDSQKETGSAAEQGKTPDQTSSSSIGMESLRREFEARAYKVYNYEYDEGEISFDAYSNAGYAEVSCQQYKNADTAWVEYQDDLRDYIEEGYEQQSQTNGHAGQMTVFTDAYSGTSAFVAVDTDNSAIYKIDDVYPGSVEDVEGVLSALGFSF